MTSQVSESLMAPGTWQLELSDRAPDEIFDLADKAFARLLICPVHHEITDISFAALQALAIYSGVFRASEHARSQWKGLGLAALMGDDEDKGNTYATAFRTGALPRYNGTSADGWLRKYVLRTAAGGANGITQGDFGTAAASPTDDGNIDVGDTQRDVLEWVCDTFTADKTNPQEWRVNPDATLDQRRRNSLWPSTLAPTAIAARDIAADDTDLRGLPVLEWGDAESWEHWRSETVAVGPTKTIFGVEYTFSGSDSIGSNPFRGIGGAAPIIMRKVDTINQGNSNAANASKARRRQGRHEKVERRLAIRSDIEIPHEVVKVGDTMWVFDPETGLVDTANARPYGGDTVYPFTARVTDLDWQIPEGVGVYVNWWNGSALELTDVTRWVQFGSGPVTVGVGSPRRGLRLARRAA